MNRLFKLQFLGPLALFVASVSCELSARFIAIVPTSETVWYLNLRVFGGFRRSNDALNGYVDIDGFQLFGIALPIFALACVGLTIRSKLPLALSTQFAAGYAAFLLMSWQSPGPLITQASLGAFPVPSGAGSFLLAGIMVACLTSCTISHILYLRAGRVRASTALH